MLSIHKAVLRDTSEIAAKLGIKLFLIGAVARDELFIHAEDPCIGRKTLDIDFACYLKDWDDYEHFIRKLEASGNFERSNRCKHQVIHLETGIPVDLVPFGDIESEDHTIIWPPDGDIKMNVKGFRSAYENGKALGEGNVRRIGPEWYAMLKLSTWLDNPNRGKDVQDFDFVARHYSEIIGDERIWASDVLDQEEAVDVDLAAVRLLGRDCAQASPEFASDLITEIYEDQIKIADLTCELEKYYHPGRISSEEVLRAFRLGIDDITANRQG